MASKSKITSDKIITERQTKTLLREVAREKENAEKKEKWSAFILDYFLFSITYFTGLRISEISNLKWGDVFHDSLVVRNGKGGKTRTVIFGSQTKKLFLDLKTLQKNMKHKKCEEPDFIFLGQRGKLTRFGIHERMKYWVQRLGLPSKLSFHSLRHGAATRWLDNGIPISSVRDQLGHSSITTTSVYLHFTKEAKEKIKAIC